ESRQTVAPLRAIAIAPALRSRSDDLYSPVGPARRLFLPRSDRAMRSSWRLVAPLVVWLAIVVIPHPPGLSRNAWSYFGLFAAVVVALVLEPLPPAAVGWVGVTLATVLGFISTEPAEAIKWG